MASSDFGFIHDGQMVSAANALHLPVNTVFYMRLHHQWWHDFYNRWWNDMNIIADNSCNQELIGGEAWFGKVAEQLAENYTHPEQRYRTIQKLDGFVQDALSYKPLDRT
jgi:lipid A disaccharide synthetase